MNVEIDKSMCVGCGLCEENLPQLFIMRNQVAHVIGEGLCGLKRREIENMVEDCPAEAIHIVDDEDEQAEEEGIIPFPLGDN